MGRKNVLLIADNRQVRFVLHILSETIRVAAVVMTTPEKPNDLSVPVYDYDCLPEVIENIAFDKIMLMSGNWAYDEQIVKQLTALYVAKKNIISLFAIASSEMISLANVVKSCVNGVGHDKKSLITGMSYAHCGVDEDVYQSGLLNLTTSSQDLYYDYQLAKIALSKPHSFQYAIIGLAPYSFHYDLSLSSLGFRTLSYYIYTRDLHHYQAGEAITSYFNDRYLNLYHELDGEFKQYQNYMENLKRTRRYDPRNDRGYLGWRKRAEAWKDKFYPDTLQENRQILADYLALCISQGIKPVVVQFPVTKVYRSRFNQRMLEGFYIQIAQMQKEYPFKFLDYYATDLFCDEDFFDVDHLNADGATKVSKMINEALFATDLNSKEMGREWNNLT